MPLSTAELFDAASQVRLACGPDRGRYAAAMERLAALANDEPAEDESAGAELSAADDADFEFYSGRSPFRFSF